MLLQLLLAGVLGIFAGGIVNWLADDLPYRRTPARPTYADGSPRPVSAWLGLAAFALGQRKPQIAQPNADRARPHRGETNALSWRHPLTELATAALMMLTVYVAPTLTGMTTPQLIFYLIYVAILVLITVIDIEHKLILFVVTIPAIALALVDAWLLPAPPVGSPPILSDALFGAVFGFGFFFLLYLGGYGFVWLMNKTRDADIEDVAFGYGDVMLFAFTGAMLGTLRTLLAIFYTVMFGALGAFLYLVARRFLTKRYGAFDAIPYGPYIVAATLLLLLYGEPLLARTF